MSIMLIMSVADDKSKCEACDDTTCAEISDNEEVPLPKRIPKKRTFEDFISGSYMFSLVTY